MTRFVVKRCLYAVGSLFILSVTIFLLIRLTGDPVTLLAAPDAKQEDLEALRAQLGLDRSWPVQYLHFVGGALRGDFGTSLYYRVPAGTLYWQRLPASLQLAAAAMAISLVVGLSVGILAAVNVDRWWDGAGKLIALLGLSMPSFWLGLLLIYFFAVYLHWLPTSGRGTAAHLVMPSVALSGYFTAAHMRLTRSSMLDVLGSDYVKLARLKGLPEFWVLVKHAFKNALIPVVTLAGINLVLMINVAVVVETVFAWPGIGRLLYEGIEFRDFPVVQTVVLLGGVMVIAANLTVDILYAWIDPRIRLER